MGMGTGIEEHSPWALGVPLGPGTREEKVLKVRLEVTPLCPYQPHFTKGNTKSQGGEDRAVAGTSLFQASCLGQLLIRSQTVISGLQAPSQGFRAVRILLGLEAWSSLPTAGRAKSSGVCTCTAAHTT